MPFPAEDKSLYTEGSTNILYGMEIFQKGDESHIKALNKMQELIQSPIAMKD